MSQKEAPLHSDAIALCEWLLGRLGEDQRLLSRRICEDALDLHQAVALALHGRRREAMLEEADERLIALRTRLRLAGTLGYLEERQVLFALEATDRIGRQIGGWLRKLGEV